MPPVPARDVAFPALWLFLLGLILLLGILRQRRARHDVRDDWNRLVRFHETLAKCVATRGTHEAARLELLALGGALDGAVPPADGRRGLAAQAAAFDPGGRPAGLPGPQVLALDTALRADILVVDRALQARMREGERAAGRLPAVFLAGTGAILVGPLAMAHGLGLVRRLVARRVEESLWFHAAVGVVVFVVLAGTVFAALQAVRVGAHLARGAGLVP